MYHIEFVTWTGQLVEERGVFPSDLAATTYAKSKGHLVRLKPLGRGWFYLKPSYKDLHLFCWQMALFLGQGLSLKVALEAFYQQRRGRLAESVLHVLKSLERGQSCAQAFLGARSLRDPILLAQISIGEKTGRLHLVFNSMATYYGWVDQLTSSLFQKILYPAFMLVLMMGLFAFMSLKVLPGILVFLKGSSIDPPFATYALMVVASFLDTWGMVLLLGFFSFVALGVLLCHIIPSLLDRISYIFFFKLAKWIYPPYIEGRLTYALGLMLAEGVSLMEALEAIKSIIGNHYTRKCLNHVQQALRQGSNVSIAFESSKILSKISLLIITAGERTGTLGEALLKSSKLSESIFKSRAELLSSAIPRLLMVTCGLLLLWLFMAICLPLYDTLEII